MGGGAVNKVESYCSASILFSEKSEVSPPNPL